MSTITKWRLVPSKPDQDWTDAFATRGPRIGSFDATIRAVLDAAPSPGFELVTELQAIRAALAFLPATDAAVSGLDRIIAALSIHDAAGKACGCATAASKQVGSRPSGDGAVRRPCTVHVAEDADVKLPRLPIEDLTDRCGDEYYLASSMRDYARAAVLMDRQHRVAQAAQAGAQEEVERDA